MGFITVPTENLGTLTIDEAELRAANVDVVWDAHLRVLQVVIRWHDDGRPGSPEITVEGDEAIVKVRQPVPAKSLLERAQEEMDRMMGEPLCAIS